MTTPWGNCARCGTRRRMVNPAACIDCRRIPAGQDPADDLGPGEWVLQRNIRIWVAAPRPEPAPPVTPKRGPKSMPDFFEWDWTDLIEARRLHGTGERTPWAIEGNRVYKRETKRRQRATKTEQKEAA